MGNRRFEMFQFRQAIVRMRLGDSDRDISRARLMGRKKAGTLRELAQREAWLDLSRPVPDEAAIAAALSPPKPRKSATSLVAAHTDEVRGWWEEGIQGTAIHQVLVRKHKFTGSYSSVHRFLAGLEAKTPRPAGIDPFVPVLFDPLVKNLQETARRKLLQLLRVLFWHPGIGGLAPIRDTQSPSRRLIMGQFTTADRGQIQPAAKTKTPRPTVMMDYPPADAVQVDFGVGPKLLDTRIGQVVPTWFFVMTLCWSRHQSAEFVTDQRVATWLGCHRRAFEWFGGRPSRVIIDNPKCAITRACYHDPEVQRSYHEFAEGYRFQIAPCPAADPRKKGYASYCTPPVRPAYPDRGTRGASPRSARSGPVARAGAPIPATGSGLGSRRFFPRRPKARPRLRRCTRTPKRSATASIRPGIVADGSAVRSACANAITSSVSLWPPRGPRLRGNRPITPSCTNASWVL